MCVHVPEPATLNPSHAAQSTEQSQQAKKPDKLKTLNISVAFVAVVVAFVVVVVVVGPLCGILFFLLLAFLISECNLNSPWANAMIKIKIYTIYHIYIYHAINRYAMPYIELSRGQKRPKRSLNAKN